MPVRHHNYRGPVCWCQPLVGVVCRDCASPEAENTEIASEAHYSRDKPPGHGCWRCTMGVVEGRVYDACLAVLHDPAAPGHDTPSPDDPPPINWIPYTGTD